MRRWKLILTLALAAIAALICAALLWPGQRDFPQSKTLPDGSVLTVEFVTCGTNVVYHETPPKSWQLAIGRRLPYGLAQLVGWRFDTKDWFSVANPDGREALGIFTKREGAGKYPNDYLRAIVLDEDGNTVGDTYNHSGGSLDSAGLHYHEFQIWAYSAFPRRHQTLVVRFLQRRNATSAEAPVAEFRIANPRPGSYPEWTPEPLPVSKDAGGLDVSLTDFATGMIGSILDTIARTPLPKEETEVTIARPFPIEETEITMDVSAKNSNSASNWDVSSIEVSDATGNRWVPSAHRKYLRVKSEMIWTESWPDKLWAGEAAWKLNVTFSPRFEAPPVASTVITRIPIPPDGSNLPLDLSTNIAGFSLHLKKIQSGNIQVNGGLSIRTVALYCDIKGMPENDHLYMIKARDERGPEIDINRRGELRRGGDSFTLIVPPDTVSLDCTFAAMEDRTAQFMAKPRLLK